MAENQQNNHHLAGWLVTQPNYRGNARYFVVQGNALFKKIRVENDVIQFVEMSNELICNSLGKMVGVPLVTTFVGILPGEGIGLFSIMLGEQAYNPSDQVLQSKITNLQKLKDLFVFDQWIYNDDRRADHIVIGAEPIRPNQQILYAYDHGHTLNGYQGQKWTMQTLGENVYKSVGQVLFDSGIKNCSELNEPVNRIMTIPDDVIDTIINFVVSTISQMTLSQEDISRVTNNAQIVNILLKKRRDNLKDIIKKWCDDNKKPASV